MLWLFSKITDRERGSMSRPLFFLVFPYWKTTRKQKFSQWTTCPYTLTIFTLYSTYSIINSVPISKHVNHIIFSISKHQQNINELCRANNYHNGDGLHGDTLINKMIPFTLDIHSQYIAAADHQIEILIINLCLILIFMSTPKHPMHGLCKDDPLILIYQLTSFH